jgi:hypothetical protein
LSVPSTPTSGSNSVDFLVRQVLGAAKNTKSRINEIVVDEIIKTAGCSDEQLFEGNDSSTSIGQSGGQADNKIHIKLSQIDLFKILDKDPSEGFNDLLFEKDDTDNGTHPFSMNKELFKRTQLVNESFYDSNGQDYIGESGNQIMNIKYVTEYLDDNNILQTGDFIEVTLNNRPGINNLSDFLRDYYKSIDLIEFDTLGIKIMNELTNVIDLSVGMTSSQKTEQNKFEKIIQRILGLCFDGREEIDVSGSSKIPVLDDLDESFFEMSNMDLRIIEDEVNNFIDGVTEFEGCDGVRLPNSVDLTCEKLRDFRKVDDGSKQVESLINIVESMPIQENWKLFLPDSLNIDLSIKTGLLKIIPRAVVTTILSPKTLLGLMIALKSVGSIKIIDIEDFKTFTINMREFMVNLISKIGAVFVEELFKLLKKNIRKLVELLMIEIVKESKDARVKMITSIIFVLLQLTSAALDWRQCKSVVDEIINLLSLIMALSGGKKLPMFALASSGLLGGYSPTRAFAQMIEKFEREGLPTGALPDGTPNKFLPALKHMMDAMNDENLSNGKTEIFIPPLSVIALGGGTTLPGRGIGKSY